MTAEVTAALEEAQERSPGIGDIPMLPAPKTLEVRQPPRGRRLLAEGRGSRRA